MHENFFFGRWGIEPQGLTLGPCSKPQELFLLKAMMLRISGNFNFFLLLD
jgi:hypothetical protein